MFEGWLGEIITRFVGHFLDVKTEQLRVSLWSGWSTSLVLENARLKVEAFEYLQLPFNIREGCIGRLEIQVPWRALQSRPVVLHLSDVWLCACPRTEAEWEEGKAGQRAQAAKQAELAALDLIRQSKPGGKSAAAGNEGSSLASSFLSHLGTMLLNRLQMTICNIHICFKDDASSPGTEIGLRLHLLETAELSSVRLGNVPAGAKLVKDMHVEGLSLYWKTADSSVSESKAVGTVGAWLDTVDCTAGLNRQHDPLEGAILPCLDCTVRLTMSSGKEETSCGVTVIVQRLEMQLEQDQLRSMAAFADRALIWSLRSKYAIYRPDGWRSDPHSAVSWRRVWQYAIKAVLQDVKKPSRWLSFAEMSKWQLQRNRYEKLHLRRLETLTRAGEPEVADEAKELEELEAQLPVNDILLYRLLAEHRVQQKEVVPVGDAEAVQASSEAARQQSWLGWGVSSVAGYLGYVPSQSTPQELSPPSESDIQELFHDLGFDPQMQVDSREASATVGINVRVRVNAAILTIFDGPAALADTTVVSMEAGDASIEVLSQAGRLQLTCSVQEIAAHDLCTHGAGISEVLLTRWDKEAASPLHAEAEMSSPFVEASSSIFTSGFLTEDSALEPQAPALHLQYDSGAPRQQQGTAGDVQSNGNDTQPSLEVAVQPLQLMHRSACFARLQGLLSDMPQDLHSDRVLHAINQIASPAGRALAKAELALIAGPPLRLHLEVVDFMMVSGGSLGQGRHAHAALCTGPVELHSYQQLDSAAMQALVTELRNAVHAKGGIRSWQAIAEQVEIHVLYDAFQMSAASLRVQVSSAADPRKNATQVLYPLCVSSSLRLGKLPDRLLPQTRLQVSVEPVEVSLTPDQLAVLGHVAALEQAADSKIAHSAAALHSSMTRTAAVSAVPKVEIVGKLAGLFATFDDGRGANPDADDTHLMLHAGDCNFVAYVFDDSIRCKATVRKLGVSDSSVYTVSPPRIWGTLPRLAGRLSIEQTGILLEQESGIGFMVSVELSGAEAEGFQAEPGNFIRRLRSSVPATGTVTHTNTRELLQTSVTLQDGCFGASTLMRIAALFVNPEKAEEPLSAGHMQATTAIAISSPAAETEPSVPHAPVPSISGVSQEHLLASSFQLGFSQPTGRSTSTEPGGTSQSELERWESASGSLDMDGMARRSREGSSSPSTQAAERVQDQAAAAQELFVLDEEMFASPSRDPSGQSSDRRSTADRAEALHHPAELEDRLQTGKAAEMERADEPPPARLDQFSLQILRCRILCPDWRDTAFAPGNPRDSDDGQALVLDVPEFLLQLPPQAPMQHPHVHPVQEHRSGAPTMPSGSAEPSGMREEHDAAPSEALPQGSEPGQLIAAGAQLGFYVQVFDPGKGLASGPRRPFLGVPEFKVLTNSGSSPSQDQLREADDAQQPMLSYTVSLDSIQVTAEPHMLQVLRAAADWGSSEMAHILGVSEQQSPEGSQRRRAQPGGSMLESAPFRLSISVDSVAVRVNGTGEGDPPLLLGLQALSLEACRAAQALTCSASFERLLVHLSSMPEAEPMEAPGLDVSPQRPGLHPMGRSASAPSAYKQRTGTVLDALPSWGGLDLVEAGSSSSLSSVTSEAPFSAVRTTSTGLAELATLGSSPDTWPQPVISGRRGSDVLSWSSALDAAMQEVAEEMTPKSTGASSSGSPSFSPALSQRDSGDTFFNASSGSLSQSLHRVSSSGTEVSAGSGTEWFEAPDYDSDTFGTASSAGVPLDVNGGREDERDIKKLALLLVQGLDEESSVLQMPRPNLGSSQAGLRAGVTLQMRGQNSMSLTCTGVLVRLFTQGWVVVVQRLQSCMTALGRVETLPAAMHSRDSVIDKHAQGIIETCSERNLSVRAGLLVFEVVATSYRGGGLSVPYISASLGMHASGSFCRDKFWLSEVALPQAAVRVGLAQQDGDTVSLSQQHDAGVICALRRAEVGLEAGEHELEPALAVSLEKMSVWASHSRVCLAMVFAMAMQDLASELGGDCNASDATKAHLSVLKGITGRGSLRIGSAAVMLSSDTSAGDLPIFDASIMDTSADATLEDGQLSGALNAQICGNVYSSQKDGWEPVIEPWCFAIDATALLHRNESDAIEAPVQQSISVSAKEVLDLTATFTLAEAIQKSMRLLEALRSVANAPQQLEAVLEGSLHERGWGHASVCWLQNETGLSAQCWLDPTLQPSSKKPGDDGVVMLESGSSATLSLHSVVSASCRSQLASCPELFFDVQPVPPLAVSTSMGALQEVTNGRKSRPPPQALYYRLDGQEGICGPLPIDRETHGMHEVAVRTARSSGLTRLRLAFDVSSMRSGEPAVVLHSGVQVVNHTMLRLNIGERTSLNRDVKIIHTLAPHESFCLSACRSEPGLICFQPAGEQDETSHYQWSPSIRLQPLLDLVQPSGAGSSPDRNRAPRVARHLACQAAQGGLLQSSFCVGVVPSRTRAGWDLIVKAPLVVENALPMPTEISLKRTSTTGAPSGAPMRVALRPRHPIFLHHLDITHLAELVVQPFGYLKSPPVQVPALRKAAEASLGGSSRSSTEETATVSFQVTQAGESRGVATVQLRHMVDAECGSHILRFTCALWVYNCTGVPLALQQSEMEDVSRDDDEVIEDVVPKQWVPPFEGKGRSGSASAASKPPVKGKAKEGSSSGSLQGLEAVLGTGREDRSNQPPRNRSANRVGVAESLEYQPSYLTPTRWPSMQGGMLPYRRRVRMQLRASRDMAPLGRTYWSDPVQLDSLGGAAVVSIPCPVTAPSSGTSDPPSAYMLSVTANQVPGADGALAVVVMPRYVLHNSLGLPLQHRQQGTTTEKEVAPGGAKALRWTNSALPKRLCLRVQEAGWLWSGGVSLDSPGDFFVKIRHRDRGLTMLVRVDVCAAEGGVLVINVSHQAAGFTPYRLDNCSSETLHLRQLGCEKKEDDDVLRPYSHLNYAWDEPSLPHKLVLSLPGNLVLGTFKLDQVGTSQVVTVPGSSHYHVRERSLQVVTRAEGPTCVLTVADLQVHLGLPMSRADGSGGNELGWERWSGPLADKQGTLFSSQTDVVRAPSALHAEVQLDLAGVGLSFSRPTQEVFYASMSGIRARATTSNVRHTLELEIRSIQVDNPDREAIYPVVLAMPATAPGLSLTILPETLPSSAQSRSSALRTRAAAWKRRPAGVLCVERLEVHVAPLVLEIDQQHITDILAAISQAMQPFQGPHSTERRRPGLDLDVDMLAPGYNARQLQQLKVYIAHLFVSRVTVYMSFLPAEWRSSGASIADYNTGGGSIGTGMQRLVALVGEVEGGRVSLAPLRMEHPLLGTTALQQQVYSHYMRAALPELVKLVGSANVLGDPVRLFHHLGAGVWSFLASPAAGLVEGARGRAPERFAASIYVGLRGLLSNIVYGFSNATAKISGAARKWLLVLGFEPRDSAAGPLRVRLHSRMRERGHLAVVEPGFLDELLKGLVGVLSEPVRGADEGGLPGLVRGAARGAVGALVLPLAAVLETSMRVADSIRSAVMGIPPLLPRARPPRHVVSNLPLAPYNWSEAMGRALLLGLERGRYASAPFLLCRQLAGGSDFAVLTRRRLLCICAPSQTAPPTLRWAVALEDLFHIRRQQASLVVVALQPSVVQPTSPIALLRRPVLIRPSRSPLFSAVLLCKGETDAEMLQQAVEHAQASAQVHSLAPLVQRINHSQHWWQARAAAAPEVALLTAGEGNAPGGPVGRPAPEELMSADTREELLAAQILAAVRGLAGT